MVNQMRDLIEVHAFAWPELRIDEIHVRSFVTSVFPKNADLVPSLKATKGTDPAYHRSACKVVLEPRPSRSHARYLSTRAARAVVVGQPLHFLAGPGSQWKLCRGIGEVARATAGAATAGATTTAPVPRSKRPGL